MLSHSKKKLWHFVQRRNFFGPTLIYICFKNFYNFIFLIVYKKIMNVLVHEISGVIQPITINKKNGLIIANLSVRFLSNKSSD